MVDVMTTPRTVTESHITYPHVARRARSSVRVALTDRDFLVHYLQMVASMLVGMVLLGPLAMLIGDTGVEAGALLMATSMTLGMTAWMTWRRHSGRAVAEMAAVMYLSFVVLMPLYWSGALSGDGLVLAGHVVMLPAMALLMLYRRPEYVGARRVGA